MTFEKVTGSTADTFLEYIQRNLPEGVAMTVTKVQTGQRDVIDSQLIKSSSYPL